MMDRFGESKTADMLVELLRPEAKENTDSSAYKRGYQDGYCDAIRDVADKLGLIYDAILEQALFGDDEDE